MDEFSAEYDAAGTKARVVRPFGRAGSPAKRLRPEDAALLARQAEAYLADVTTKAHPQAVDLDGAMVAVFLRPADAFTLAEAEGANLPADFLHVTLAYLGKVDELDPSLREVSQAVLEGLASERPSLTARITAGAEFGDAYVALLDAPDLGDLREELVDRLEAAGVQVRRDHGFLPHVSLAYEPDADVETPVGMEVQLEAVTLAWGPDRDRYELVGHVEEKTRRVRTPDGARRFGQSIGSVIRADITEAMADPAAQRFAHRVFLQKIREVPRPSAETVEKHRRMAERIRASAGKLRAGGELRGNTEQRRRSRNNLFKQFGGERFGYVPCVWCGIKLSAHGERGLPQLQRDKILVFEEGGGYQLPNLAPSCPWCNRDRGARRIGELVRVAR